jgi:hypothetical protein
LRGSLPCPLPSAGVGGGVAGGKLSAKTGILLRNPLCFLGLL